MLAGASLLYLAGRDVLYYAPVRKCATLFLEGLVHNAEQPEQSTIGTSIKDIHIDGNRAIVNAGLAIPGNWINTQLYAAKNSRGNWEIIGVTKIDAHVENPRNLELAKEIETAFQSSPAVHIYRQ